MSSEEFVDVTARFCHPYMSFGSSDGCDNIILKIPEQEIKKFSATELSKSELNSDLLNSDLAQLWGVSFSTVLLFYFTSLGIGNVLRFLKNSL